MFRILSGILTIGNLEFLIDEEGFTRQNLDEEKTRQNLAIIAVRKYLANRSIRKTAIFLEYVRCQFGFNYGMSNNDYYINTKRTSDEKI